jgi:ABC-type lipoprotein release transport system permease subunit
MVTPTTTVVPSASVDSEPTFQQAETATRSPSFSPAVRGGPLGAAAGAAIGLSLNLWFRTHGLDLAALSSGGSFEIFGVAFGDRIYFDWTAADVLTPTGLIIGISLLCGLWPAWWGMRLNAIQAVAGRT